MIKKIILSTFIIFFIISMTFSLTFATTASLSDVQNKINDAKKEQTEVKNQMSDAMKEVQELNSSIAKSEEELKDLENKTNQLNNQINEIQKQIDEATEKYNKQYDELCKLVVAQYENGSAVYLDVLLNSTSLSNFLSKYYLISEIVQYDNDLLKQIQEEKEKIIKSKEELQVKQTELKEATVQAQKTNIILRNNKAKQQSYYNKLSDEEKSLQDKINEYENELKTIEAQIRAAAARNNGTANANIPQGQLLWPCPNYVRISSTYGYRYLALYGYTRLHAGIDMAAPAGAPILAAESGTVTISTKGSGYGNWIMINHGNGMSTVYGHGLDGSRLVNVGDKVTRGQQIMSVGSTGNSTGNHLHFEVRINGSAVNPAPYIGL